MYPNVKGLRTLKIRASEVGMAIERAQRDHPAHWHAELLEILLIPKVYRRWRMLNRDVYSLLDGYALKRVAGQVYTRSIEAREVEDWTIYNGYVLYHPGSDRVTWNSVRNDGYSHSPWAAFDGVRRETFSRFLDALRMYYHHYTKPEFKAITWMLDATLREYRMEFVNDLAEAGQGTGTDTDTG